MIGLGDLLSAVPILDRIWAKLRYPVRIEVNLAWDSGLLVVPGAPLDYHRVLRVTLTAGRFSEFIVAEGEVEAQTPDSRWTHLGTLSDFFVPVPIEVSANRAEEVDIEGWGFGRRD